MTCEFCKEAVSFMDVDKRLDPADTSCAYLLKDQKGNVAFGMRIYDTDYACLINYCPLCGRKLTEDNNNE